MALAEAPAGRIELDALRVRAAAQEARRLAALERGDRQTQTTPRQNFAGYVCATFNCGGITRDTPQR